MAMRSANLGILGAIALALCLSPAACGKAETVELLPTPDDGGLPDSSFGDTAPPDDGATRPCDLVDAGPRQACRGNGASCQGSSDCCSSRCDGNVCLAAGICAGPGASCATRDQCCSGRCEPSAGAKKCTSYCLADGASCTSPQDCCSLACNAGACGGTLCSKEDATCATNADCCSGTCDGTLKKCRQAGSCKGTGDQCETAECCSGVCTTGGGLPRCDPGPGPCRLPGNFCSTDADCCRAPCSLGPNGYKVCAAPPQPDGQGCTSNADCTSRICSGAPPVCGAPAAQCKLVGSPCNIASDCCSDLCTAGFCGTNCIVH